VFIYLFLCVEVGGIMRLEAQSCGCGCNGVSPAAAATQCYPDAIDARKMPPVMCSVMFSVRVVGTANATAAGWGNMGGGVVQLIMPLLLQGLSNVQPGEWDSCGVCQGGGGGSTMLLL
jgi:hypothetical protein